MKKNNNINKVLNIEEEINNINKILNIEKTKKIKETALQFINICKSFGEKKVLNNISFAVKTGTVHGFIGPNGAGKTTTMSAAVRLSIPNSGDILVFGNSIAKNMYTNSYIGFCPSETDMMQEVEVEDLILSYNMFRGLSKKIILESLKKTSLNRFRYHKIKHLSTGWRKIVQLFNVSLSKPDILILDEPFNGLDPIIRRNFFDKIKKLRSMGRTILLSTHILSDLQELAEFF